MGERIGNNGHLFQFTFPRGDFNVTLKQATLNKEKWYAMLFRVIIVTCHATTSAM
jgi:hypothetical protein